MNDEEKKLLLRLRREGVEATVQYLSSRYENYVAKDIDHHERLELVISQRWLSPSGIFYQFAHILHKNDLSDSSYNIRQLLHLLVVNRAYQYPLSPGVIAYMVGEKERYWRHAGMPPIKEMLGAPLEKDESKRPNIRAEHLIIRAEQSLSPAYLQHHLLPYLQSLADMQSTCDVILNREHNVITIKRISQESPVEISFQGVADAVKTVLDVIVPWRRQNAKVLAALKTLELAVEIEKKKEEMRTTASKALAEARKTNAEATKILQDAEKQRLENMKLEADVEVVILDMALKKVNEMNPRLSQDERTAFALRMLPTMKRLATSEIEIERAEE